MTSKLGLILVVGLALAVPAGAATPAAVVREAGSSSLELSFDASGATDIVDAREGWLGLEIPGFSSIPDDSLGLYVPTSSYLVAIPVGGDVRVEITDPVVREVTAYDGSRLAESPNLATHLPTAPAEITARGYIRNQRVACLRVTPLVYDASSGRMKEYTRFGVRVAFSGGTAAAMVGGAGRSEGTFEATYRAALVNYEQGKQWRRRPTVNLAAATGDYFSSSPNWIKIKVETTGVYCLTGRDLADAGVSIGQIDSRTLRIYSGPGLPLNESIAQSNQSWMRQLAVRVADGGDNNFGTGDSVIFYALGSHDFTNLFDSRFDNESYTRNYYSDFNCYWLTWGGAFSESPSRMEKIDIPECGSGCTPYKPASFLERLHYERDNLHDFAIRAEDGWYWQPLRVGETLTLNAAAPSPDVSKPGLVKVRVADWQREDANNRPECGDGSFRIILRVAGAAVADDVWPSGVGGDVHDVSGTFTPGSSDLQRVDIVSPASLPPGTPGSVCDRLYLAWYEVFVWRRFVAAANRIFFPSPDTTAATIYEIGGFSSPSVYVLDVTDQFGVKQLVGSPVTGGPSYTVSVSDTTRSGRTRRYAVLSPSGLRKPTEISRAGIDNIRGGPGAPYCVITHEDLLGPARKIADFRGGELVTVQQIYDEFGWGVPDATAVRDFLKWRLTQGSPIERVLLFGDASWDSRGYLGANTSSPNYVPTYERRYLPPVSSPYSTDDWLAYLVPDDSDTAAYWPTLPISRMPALSAADGEGIVSRTIDYVSSPEKGIWQSKYIMAADDDKIGADCPDGHLENIYHTIFAEQLVNGAYPHAFQPTKIYLTEYPLGPSGLKTAAKNDFVKALNEGALVANFIGHGDELRLAQEEVFNPAAVELVHTGRRPPFFIAASCNVSRFDEPGGSSMAEGLLRRSEGGTVGSLASTHLAGPSPNQELNKNVITAIFGGPDKYYPVLPIADAVQVAKAATVAHSQGYYTNDEMYALFGDPALELASPELSVEFEPIAEDTLVRGKTYSFQARVMEGTQPASDFEGQADVRMREAADTSGYLSCYGYFIQYWLPGTEIFRGKMNADQGTINLSAVVPVDAREGGRGSVRCFVSDGNLTGVGTLGGFVISGQAVSEDHAGPAVALSSGERTLSNGDSVVVGQTLLVDLTDESGVAIKAKSEFIASVTVSVDGSDREDLTDSVYSVGGDLTHSVTTFAVPLLARGEHTFLFSALDNFGNLGTREYTLLVESKGLESGSLVFAYPNPASGSAYVVCEYDRPVMVDVTIYTVSGRKIWTSSTAAPASYHQVLWNGADMEDDRVANGAYLVKVEAADPNDPAFSATKTIILALIR